MIAEDILDQLRDYLNEQGTLPFKLITKFEKKVEAVIGNPLSYDAGSWAEAFDGRDHSTFVEKDLSGMKFDTSATKIR